MSDRFHQLVYVSRNRVAGDDNALAIEVGRILEQAREGNDLSGITGALLFNSQIFAQVLEGPRAEVEKTFGRIERDTRHSDVSVLSFDPVGERHFGRWSMGYFGRETDAAQQFKFVGELSGFDSDALDGDSILELMESHMHEAR